ncbi:hypothetical protein ACPOL_4163 [Acidisarcina polymorpha]|uniref:DUF433 domain-containing protein n=1 Tax=Acidisarcina polymorpha TaxID=2211140 RepID=A0A2Z5G334_9BACT|nr:DUF433 domain-containing protein [Acidisarcina polymorpha]AXC13440.1 hypothetical protein ACPOL_4163 [Acidisarcina polymorpha]
MTEIDWSDCPIVETNPEKMGGVPTLRAWRLSADSIVDNHDYGATAQDIHDWFHVPLADVESLFAYAEAARDWADARSVR